MGLRRRRAYGATRSSSSSCPADIRPTIMLMPWEGGALKLAIAGWGRPLLGICRLSTVGSNKTNPLSNRSDRPFVTFRPDVSFEGAVEAGHSLF
jgi:hypothetical protein